MLASAANTKPTATNVFLSDTSPKTNDTISVSFDYADADRHTPTLFPYTTLFRSPADSGFSDISGATSSSLNLSTLGNGDRGDQLKVLVKPKDGTDFGAQVASSVEEGGEGEARATNVLPCHDWTKTNDTISVSFDYADADGHTQSGTSYQSQKQGTADSGFSDISGATSSSLNLSTLGNGDRGDQLKVLVKPKDGTDFGAQVAS